MSVQRISTQRRDINQHREAVLAKARQEVEREWQDKQAASDQDAEESRARVAVERERRHRIDALIAERTTTPVSPADSDSGGSPMATKKATKSITARAANVSIVYPKGKAPYWHMHQTGPTHSGVVSGTTLTTACGKALKASGPGGNYWRPTEGRAIDCKACLEALGGKVKAKVTEARPHSAAGIKRAKFTPVPKPGKGKVKNYSGTPRKARAARKPAVIEGLGAGEPTPAPVTARKRSF